MAEETPLTLQAILGQLLSVFVNIEPGTVPFKESLAALQDIHHNLKLQEPTVDLGTLSLDHDSNQLSFRLVATCLNEARISKSKQLSDAFSLLADVSRKPCWRLDLGKCESRSTHTGWPPDPKHESNGYSHEQWLAFESESILQVAVRTLHPRHVKQMGHAGFHAIRIISNCCADNDANKRVVLECGGLELLFRCANLKLWPATAIAALWNICAESETEAGLEAESGGDNDMSNIACIQLALRSTGECDDSNGKSLLAAEIADGRRHAHTIKELLDIADIVKDQKWKEMVAELLEKTSWSVSRHHHKSSTPETDIDYIPSSTRLTKTDLRTEEFLAEILTGSGRRLAMSSRECNYDVTRTIAVLLSQQRAQRELIRGDLVRVYLEVPIWNSSKIEDNIVAGADVSKPTAVVQQSLFSSIYAVSALPEFAAKYMSTSSKLVNACIDALRDASSLSQTMEPTTSIPAAAACIVLANLTTSADFALLLVQSRKVHLSVGELLRQRDDSTTLFPAIALLDRLAIPKENKLAIVQAGVIHELPRFLMGFDVKPMIQREAVSLIRKLLAGFPDHVSEIGACMTIICEKNGNGRSLERTTKQSGLLAALDLFRRTNDAQIKVETGRLVVEICRTLFRLANGNADLADVSVREAFGTASDIAHPIRYLVCNGTTQEVRGEGWFGLAVLSTWKHGRTFVMDCLNNQDVQNKMEGTLKGGERAMCQNITLMLAQLHLFPSRFVQTPTSIFLERAAHSVGLPPIWPVMASAA